MLEIKMLKQIFYKEILRNLYRVVMSRRLRWTGRVAWILRPLSIFIT